MFQLGSSLNNSLCPWQSGIAQETRERAKSEGTSFAEVVEILAGGPIFHLVLPFLLRPLRGISRASCSALGGWILAKQKTPAASLSLRGLGKIFPIRISDIPWDVFSDQLRSCRAGYQNQCSFSSGTSVRVGFPGFVHREEECFREE